MYKKIALSGAHNTGKTTLLNALKNHLKTYNYISEVVRSEFKTILNKEPSRGEIMERMLKDKKFADEMENKFLQRQIEEERKAGEKFISDRSIYDILAYKTYYTGLGDIKEQQSFYQKAIQHCNYDLIIIVPPFKRATLRQLMIHNLIMAFIVDNNQNFYTLQSKGILDRFNEITALLFNH